MNETKKARPWDIFNKNLNKIDEKIQEERMNICLGCEHLLKATTQCKKCGCFMNLKTKLPHSECPIGKWGVVKVSFKEEL